MSESSKETAGSPAAGFSARPVLAFVAFTAVFAALAYYFVIEHGLRRYYVALLMWSPGLAVLACSRLGLIDLKSIGWRWPSSGSMAMSYLLPALYGLVAYLIIWVGGFGGLLDAKFTQEVSYFLGLDGWSEGATVAFGIVMFGSVGMIWHTATALGEEIGWRGFLTPALMARYSFPVTSLIVGLAWALWHVPLITQTSYNAGPSGLEFQLLNFTVMTVGISFIMTYYRLVTDSVWPAVIMHASHNIYVLTIMQPMTIQYRESWRYVSEFGFILPVVVLLVGLFFWRKAKKDGITG